MYLHLSIIFIIIFIFPYKILGTYHTFTQFLCKTLTTFNNNVVDFHTYVRVHMLIECLVNKKSVQNISFLTVIYLPKKK